MSTASEAKERAETIAVVIAESGQAGLSLDGVAALVRRLSRISRRLRVLHTEGCNVKGATERNAQEIERLETNARAMLESVGLNADFNSDPRGSCVGFLTPKTRRVNSLAGLWRIPE